LSFSGSSFSVRTWRIVHLVGGDSPRGLAFVQFVACSCTFVVRSIGEVTFRYKGFADCPPGAHEPSAWHELLADRPYFKVQHWWLCSFFGPYTATSRTVRLLLADCLPGLPRLSAPRSADCLSPLLLELRFHVALSLGLFLGLVGPL
jgi:hypothetical protein